MRWQRWLVVVWAAFAARLLFYSAMLPLWEGYDEWAHFAVVRQVARGNLLPPRDSPIPRDVETSLALAPVPWEMRSLAPPSYTEDDYWQLSDADRARREAAFGAMPAAWRAENGSGAYTAYEALQAPLYYWLMAPALWVCGKLSIGLAGQMLAIRFLSSLLASLIVPLVFSLAQEVCGSLRHALGAAAIVALMPGLAFDVARAGNDSLAVVLFTLLTWLAVRIVVRGLTLRLAIASGCVLGLGLLTKAYFLAAIPAEGAIWMYAAWKMRAFGRAIAAVSLAVLLSGWWYARNLRTTGTLSGLSESVMLRGIGAGEMLHRAAGIHWVKAIDAILLSHLYFGGWSSLTVRSWMYHLFYIVIAVAGVGMVRSLRRPAVLALLALYISFWLAQLYNVALLYVSKGLEGSMGWYLYAVVGAEVVLCVVGLRGFAWIAAAMFALLDLYTVHALDIPYYTGMIRHRANGSLAALHWSDFQALGLDGALERLTTFKHLPLASVAGLWLAYLAATAALLAAARARKCDSAEKKKA